MKIAYFSDIHVDINSHGLQTELSHHYLISTEVDVIVIAGDISNKATKTFDWLVHQLEALSIACHGNKTLMPKVLFVPGNHDFYYQPIKVAMDIFKDLERKWKNIFYCLTSDDAPILIGAERGNTYEEVAFIGDILWTDFLLQGIAYEYSSIQAAQMGMSDFRYIWEDFHDGTKWLAKNSQLHHIRAIENFKDNIINIRKMSSIIPIVVITHHGPSYESIGREYRSGTYSHLNSAYASGILDPMHSDSYSKEIAENVKLWIHGHVHSSFDYVAEDGCRVVTNPRGYTTRDGTNENEEFSFMKIITL